MKANLPFDIDLLRTFFKKAAASTYAGGGEKEEHPERPGFIELVYKEGDFEYRDSYTGFYRSWGTETVRYKGKPIWASLYGGGMTEGNEEQALPSFTFLKKALTSKDDSSISFRGPDTFTLDDWKYHYKQEGDIDQFSGSEEISHKGIVVFTHRIIGGIVREEE